jgi:SAM-dependent methyltransferase
MSEAIGAEDWAGRMGERWLANLDAYESMLSTVGGASFEHAAFRPGERVLDIGCGGGATTRAIAQVVGPTGAVLGVDISASLIAEARRRAQRDGLANVDFIAQDAATATPPGVPFDRLYSRFGSMFFPEPKSAFTHLHSMLRREGRADFAVWAPVAQNAWVAELMKIVRGHLDLPPPEPRAPGPFSLDDPDWFDDVLAAAGFTDLRFHHWEGVQRVGGARCKAAEATQFVLDNTHFADALREAPAAVQQRVRDEVLVLFEHHETPRGVEMDAAAWFVSARA